jgi:hypothetical protein
MGRLKLSNILNGMFACDEAQVMLTLDAEILQDDFDLIIFTNDMEFFIIFLLPFVFILVILTTRW